MPRLQVFLGLLIVCAASPASAEESEPPKPKDPPVAKWGQIPKGTRFRLSWSFALKHSGNAGGEPFATSDVRTVEAELVADSDIDGKGALRIELGTVNWTWACEDYEIKASRSNKGEVKSSVRVTAPKEKAAQAKKDGYERAGRIEGFLKRDYSLPVSPSPTVVGGAWSGGALNSLFDWMMVHDNLGKDGIAGGTKWEKAPEQTDNYSPEMGSTSFDEKAKYTATSSGSGVRVTGKLQYTKTTPKSAFGSSTARHEVSREWSFMDGYFAGGKRTISNTFNQSGADKFWNKASSFSVQETLTIQKK